MLKLNIQIHTHTHRHTKKKHTYRVKTEETFFTVKFLCVLFFHLKRFLKKCKFKKLRYWYEYEENQIWETKVLRVNVIWEIIFVFPDIDTKDRCWECHLITSILIRDICENDRSGCQGQSEVGGRPVSLWQRYWYFYISSRSQSHVACLWVVFCIKSVF